MVLEVSGQVDTRDRVDTLSESEFCHLVVKTTILCSVVVCVMSVGVRMCSGAQCLAWRGG